MGLFDGFKKKEVKETVGQSGQSAEDILSRMPESSGVITLKKSTEALDRTVISLSKTKSVDMTAHKARVAVVMDFSGSMRSRYASGEVQNVLTTLMPLALKFDDNGELDVWIFANDYHRLAGMTLANFEDYVHKNITNKYSMGSTEYAPVLKDVIKKYAKEDKSEMPAFVVFITDGENDSSDRNDAERAVVNSSKENLFVQFVGIGNENFNFLHNLDDLEGRPCDNTGFIKVKDIMSLSKDELFTKLLDQYPDWLKETGRK